MPRKSPPKGKKTVTMADDIQTPDPQESEAEASLTEAVITSPRRPYWPVEPPRRWMHEIFLAPELSATSRIEPI